MGTRPDGSPYVIIGRDSVLLSVFHLENTKHFEKSDVQSVLQTKIKKMLFKPEDVKQTLEKLKVVKGFFENHHTASEKRTMVKAFIAKIELVKEIFPNDLGVPQKDLIFISQPDFHIDMHMRPLGPSQILLQDYRESLKFIEESIQDIDRRLKLTDIELSGTTEQKVVADLNRYKEEVNWRKKELISMREHAQEIQTVLQPLMLQIQTQLMSNNIQVIQAPGLMEATMEKQQVTPESNLYRYFSGVFVDNMYGNNAPKAVKNKVEKFVDKHYKNLFMSQKEAQEVMNILMMYLSYELKIENLEKLKDFVKEVGKKLTTYMKPYYKSLPPLFTRHVNYMNAVPATTIGTNQSFFITNHTCHEELADNFARFLKKNGVNQIYFAGKQGGGQFTQSSAELSLGDSGGFDCREIHHEGQNP